MTQFVGEIRLFAGNFVPANWLPCDGRLIPISNYDVLFNLLGTTYGGDGINTFGLPDLRGRVPIHQGHGQGLQTYVIGAIAGAESVTLTTQTMPQHNHAVLITGVTSGSSNTPTNSEYLANETLASTEGGHNYIPYNGGNQVTMRSASVGNAGGSQPHDNIQPYLAVTFIISPFGVYPTQS